MSTNDSGFEDVSIDESKSKELVPDTNNSDEYTGCKTLDMAILQHQLEHTSGLNEQNLNEESANPIRKSSLKNSNREDIDVLELQPDQTKPRKLVGFAPEPQEDLKDHHKYLEQRRRDRLKDNPFWKLPSELAYLDTSSNAPKAVCTLPAVKSSKTLKLKDIPDRPTRAVKEISAVNKATAINFHYLEISTSIPPDKIMIDVKYASVSTLDMTKLSKYAYNISEEKIGFGYDYVGVISKVGKNIDKDKFTVGGKVFGVTNPSLKRGALQTCTIASTSELILPITDEDFSLVEHMEVRLDGPSESPFVVDEPSAEIASPKSDEKQGTKVSKLKLPPKASYEIEDVLDGTAKFCTFGSTYCRAQQALECVDKMIRVKGNANILINGADTNLGYTITQIVASSLYNKDLLGFNIVLVVRHKNIEEMNALISHLGASNTRQFHVVSFDEGSLKGSAHIKYKPRDGFAVEIFESVLAGKQPGSIGNAESIKLDLFVDIVGSKKMFQGQIDMKCLSQGESLVKVFGSTKEALFLKLMKSKSSGSSYVAYRDFRTPEPTYLATLLSTSNTSFLNPWSVGWTLSFANLFVSRYWYYEKLELEVKKSWLEDALELVKKGELRMRINKVVDWRNNFRRDISYLQENDGDIVFKIEAF